MTSPRPALSKICLGESCVNTSSLNKCNVGCAPVFTKGACKQTISHCNIAVKSPHCGCASASARGGSYACTVIPSALNLASTRDRGHPRSRQPPQRPPYRPLTASDHGRRSRRETVAGRRRCLPEPFHHHVHHRNDLHRALRAHRAVVGC